MRKLSFERDSLSKFIELSKYNDFKIHIASKGSVKTRKGTTTWIIEHENQQLVSILVLVHRQKIDSFRADMTGIIGALSFIWILQQSGVHLDFKFYTKSNSAIKILKKNSPFTPASYDKNTMI